jgi:hypothetical protein
MEKRISGEEEDPSSEDSGYDRPGEDIIAYQ